MTSSTRKPFAVAVIGAGISGLSCARVLADAGGAVTVFEKSRSLGGRCASRRWEGNIVDHGAQYFTMRDADFRAELEGRCGRHLRMITAPFLDPRGREIPPASPRWYHAEGNNRLGRALQEGLDVRMEAPISSLRPQGERWSVEGGEFDAVVSSAPLPQTLALLDRRDEESLFAPCLTAFFAYAGSWAGNSANVYARPDPGGDLAWSACENHKSGRIAAETTVFVAQASPAFSAEHLEGGPAEWAERLRPLLESRWELSTSAATGVFTHRWRFARYMGRQPAEVSDVPAGFFVTGDGRAESRVESAWLAGRATAREVLAHVDQRR